MFGISRGFRRLSLLTGIVSFLFPALWYAIDTNHHWDGSPISSGSYTPEAESLSQRILILAAFTLIPMFLTLLTGWVVAGFHKSSGELGTQGHGDGTGKPTITDQERVRSLIKRGVIFSIVWLMEIGSLIAVVMGLKAHRLIKASGGQLKGNGGAWWCLIVGGIGLAVWIPIFAIGIFNNLK